MLRMRKKVSGICSAAVGMYLCGIVVYSVPFNGEFIALTEKCKLVLAREMNFIYVPYSELCCLLCSPFLTKVHVDVR